MLAIKITIDERSIKEAAFILRAVPRAVPRVLSRAINRAIDMSATDMKRRVGEEIAIKKSEIAKGISKKPATSVNLTGFVGAKAYRPGLLEFPGTRQTKRGVSYRVSQMAGRKAIEHGFFATMKSGHRGVFIRKGSFEEKPGPPRLPIREARGPSIWKIITDTAGLLQAVTDAAGDRMGRLISDQIGVEFRRWQNQ